MKRTIQIILVLALVGGGVWLWRVLFPGDEVLIRRQLADLAEIASFPADEPPLAKLTNAAKVAAFFTVDAEIDIQPWGYRRMGLRGRDELRQAALGARNALASLSISAAHVEVKLSPVDERATVRFTLIASSNRNPERQSQEMELEMSKAGGDWLIQRARTVDYLAQ
ncbi:MAG TPA: nuclear transport factor 2 family protein [Verrucomicrobiae bacterium]|nr:nuclear transport factor 2 family protein [Verrucomicrobiae bacterium]